MSERRIRPTSEAERIMVPYPYPPSEELRRDITKLQKEFQEFKAVVEEREKLKEAFHRKELAYITIIISLASIVIVLLCKLLHLI